MHLTHFFFQSGSLAFIAIPHLYISKFLYEFKWGLMAGVVAVASVMLMFVIPPMIIFAPLAIAFSSGAYALGTLHSMLLFMGIGSSHCEDAMLSEVIKVGMVNSVGFVTIWATMFGITHAIYGGDGLIGFLHNAEDFMKMEEALFAAGELPVLVVAAVLIMLGHWVWGALTSVIMAAASYGLGPKQDSFNGLWGFGYRWKTILVTRAIWFILLQTVVISAIIAMDPATSWETVKHVFDVFINGAPRDAITYPIKNPVFDSTLHKVIVVFLIIMGARFPEAIKASTSCIVFRERLAIHQQAKRDAMPTAAEKQAKYEEHLTQVQNLRETRMPSRWSDQ